MSRLFWIKDEITKEIVDVWVASPQGLEPEGDLYNNKYQSGYFLGKLDYNKPEFEIKTKFVELDRGNDFYAPQSMKDDKGRRIMVGWMGIPEEEDFPTVKNEWIHCLTLPRELKMINGQLKQYPIEELKKLRGEKEIFSGDVVGEKEILKGETFEIKVKISEINSSFGIKLRANESNETIVKYDFETKKLILDRSKGAQSDKRDRKVYLGNQESLELNIFVDRSSIEIFVNNGDEVFSSRIFPEKEATGIKIFADKEVKVKLEKWEWK